MITYIRHNLHTGQHKKGFTLVETLVAISIFAVSVLALMSVLSKGIANTGYAKKKIVASLLAQEGIEYARNMRDTYMLYGTSPDAGWTAYIAKLNAGGCQSANGCYINADTLYATPPPMPMTQIPLIACGASCTQLLYDGASGRYNYTTGVNAGYVRKMSATQINANEIKIFSTVIWAQGSGQYSITLSESLYNWIE